jgi:hypothetical protein
MLLKCPLEHFDHSRTWISCAWQSLNRCKKAVVYSKHLGQAGWGGVQIEEMRVGFWSWVSCGISGGGSAEKKQQQRTKNRMWRSSVEKTQQCKMQVSTNWTSEDCPKRASLCEFVNPSTTTLMYFLYMINVWLGGGGWGRLCPSNRAKKKKRERESGFIVFHSSYDRTRTQIESCTLLILSLKLGCNCNPRHPHHPSSRLWTIKQSRLWQNDLYVST